MHWVIRDRKTGDVEHCHTVMKSEVEARAALLNRGALTVGDRRSWGVLTKAGRRVKSDSLSAAEWVERLIGDPRTAALLRVYVRRDRPMRLVAVRRLLRKVGARRFDDFFIESVSKRLVPFGVRRADERNVR